MSSPGAGAQRGNPQAVSALVAAQSAAAASIRAQILSYIRQRWRALPNYRSPDQFVSGVVPFVQAGQQQIAAITAAYLSHLYAELVGQPVRMLGVPPEAVTGLRQGVTPQDVYARPFHLVWRELAAAQAQRDAHYGWKAPTSDFPTQPPLPPADYVQQAIDAGLARAENLAATDLQLAKQHAALHVLGHQEHVTGYRRVLEGPDSCGLCIVASTQRYHKQDLLPIHPGCDCSVEPIVGADEHVMTSMARTADGQLVPVGALPDVHARIADTFGKDSSAAAWVKGAKGDKGRPIHYRDVIVTHDHGELGPVLGVRGQTFSTLPDMEKKPPGPAAVTTS